MTKRTLPVIPAGPAALTGKRIQPAAGLSIR